MGWAELPVCFEKQWENTVYSITVPIGYMNFVFEKKKKSAFKPSNIKKLTKGLNRKKYFFYPQVQ